ncbi:hypothetical protein [Agaribacterium sp. ZY112]|uniref:hypothetical protein n=1 Tax=Agaribacterium sp. ZY112 TaxID=3233574 RepID=UPI00352555F0
MKKVFGFVGVLCVLAVFFIYLKPSLGESKKEPSVLSSTSADIVFDESLDKKEGHNKSVDSAHMSKKQSHFSSLDNRARAFSLVVDADPEVSHQVAMIFDVDPDDVYLLEFHPDYFSQDKISQRIQLDLPGLSDQVSVEILEIKDHPNGKEVRGRLADLPVGFGVSFMQSNNNLNGYIVTPEWRYDITTVKKRSYMIKKSHQEPPGIGLSINSM